MEMLAEIIGRLIAESLPSFALPELAPLLDSKYLKILESIRNVVRNDELDDADCFTRIEKIVCLLEDSGILCGNRHDFG